MERLLVAMLDYVHHQAQIYIGVGPGHCTGVFLCVFKSGQIQYCQVIM